MATDEHNKGTRREDEGQEPGQQDDNLPATFSGDVRGGGPGAGSDLGRGGTSTPTGDIAGGGQPGSTVDIGDGTVTIRDAVPTGGPGNVARRDRPEPRQERLREEPVEIDRSALDGAPGIPAGSGEEALQTPDSELGGVIAADTTPGGATGDEPDRRQVRDEDRRRNTL